MFMGKTITITKEAYEALAREKRSNESFSDVVLRLASRKAKLSEYFGIWSEIPEDEFEKIQHAIQQARKGIRARL